MYIDETGLAEVTTKLKTYIDNKAGGGGGGPVAKIRCAEMPDVTITLSQNGTDIESKTTPATTGGIVDFEVDTIGTYTLTASGTGITTWTHNVDVTELNTIVECKAGILANYTYAQWHTACQGGYFSKMFSVSDHFQFTETGNVLDGTTFFIEDIKKENNTDIIHFRSIVTAGAAYIANSAIAYLRTATDSSWRSSSNCYGGFKYCDLVKTMMLQGEEVYSRATAILPDNYSGTLTTGIKFSDLKYSDTGLNCPIYSYNGFQNSMTLLTAPLIGAPSGYGVMLIKGYFKSVGQIDEATFNNGIYYIGGTFYTNSLYYTKATVYDSSVTYYGLYETLQEDGIFAGAIYHSTLSPYLVKCIEYTTTGDNQGTRTTISNWVDILATEEITGINENTISIYGSTINVGNYPNIGEKKKAYNNVYYFQPRGWLRDTSRGQMGFNTIENAAVGYSTFYTYNSSYVSLGFRFS